VACWLFVLFTIGRRAHTAVYVAGLQPWRTVAFAIAQIALYAISLSVLVAVL
jgi:glutathione S-transferase